MATAPNKRHFTQSAAQFAVASELCKRGYEVSFTLGHNTLRSAVSPGRLIPARELLGDPKRFRGHWGAGEAAAQASDDAKARKYFGQLVDMTAGGDERPERLKAVAYWPGSERTRSSETVYP
jgi:hypothetical protein